MRGLPKGYRHSETAIEKMRIAARGRKHSEETKLKIASAGIGRKHSEETKEKMRQNSRPGMKGKRHTVETVERMRLSHIGKKLSTYHRQRMSEVRRGKNNPMWRGGISEKSKVIRASLRYKLWREAVFKRDNYQCVNGCSRGSRELAADHIKPFSLFPELRFVLSNGRTLCRACHLKTDTFGWKMKLYKKT